MVKSEDELWTSAYELKLQQHSPENIKINQLDFVVKTYKT